ncbi:MAG: Toxin HigB-2 [Rhodocyclaceae bacterium]|nr:Toxin HigB-2 [Rhodocyclaceae bacterium]
MSSKHDIANQTQLAYSHRMKALFVELPAFSRHRAEYLSDESLRALQNALLKNPAAGEVIEGTGGLRKVRHGDPRRGKGKRGGLRVIYFWWEPGRQVWLFTLYDKDEMGDLTAKERGMLKAMLKRELEARR